MDAHVKIYDVSPEKKIVYFVKKRYISVFYDCCSFFKRELRRLFEIGARAVGNVLGLALPNISNRNLTFYANNFNLTFLWGGFYFNKVYYCLSVSKD